uniref:Uncharacterized protein n=1 Tax=Trichogramma kaykai TaxID=54128 RepID=A0ABD2WM72_9HYME
MRAAAIVRARARSSILTGFVAPSRACLTYRRLSCTHNIVCCSCWITAAFLLLCCCNYSSWRIVKDEPSDWSIRVNEPDAIDEKPDIKDVKLLSFLPENSNYRHQKCDKNHESEVKIVFECEDGKPEVDSSAVKKIEDYSENHRQFMKYGDVYTNLKIIKIEPLDNVQ